MITKMKTTKILASAFIFFALTASSCAVDMSDKRHNSIELHKQAVASAFIKNGRNKGLKFNQNIPALQFVNIQNNGLVHKAILPKGRNSETIDRVAIEASSYAKAGRNKNAINNMISMN